MLAGIPAATAPVTGIRPIILTPAPPEGGIASYPVRHDAARSRRLRSRRAKQVALSQLNSETTNHLVLFFPLDPLRDHLGADALAELQDRAHYLLLDQAFV